MSKDVKETVQECVSEFISFVTGDWQVVVCFEKKFCKFGCGFNLLFLLVQATDSDFMTEIKGTDFQVIVTKGKHTKLGFKVSRRASDKCQREKRKTINGDDLLWAMATLGFEDYIEPLKLYLSRYREMEAATKILACQLVKLRQQIANLQSSRAQMRGIATHKQAVSCTLFCGCWDERADVGDNYSNYKLCPHPHKLFLSGSTFVRKCDDFVGSLYGFSFTSFDLLRSNAIPNDSAVGRAYVNSGFQGTSLYINEDIEDINAYTARLLEKKQTESSSSLRIEATEIVTDMKTDILSNCVFNTMADVNKAAQTKIVVVLGTIITFPPDMEWYYNACNTCNRKVTYDKIYIDPTTGNELDEPKDVIVCPTSGCKDGAFDIILEEIINLVGKKYIFKIDISEFNINNKYKSFTIIKWTEDPTIISTVESTYAIEQGENSSSMIISSSDLVSNQSKTMQNSTSLSTADVTPLSLIESSTARTMSVNESFEKESAFTGVKRKLADSFDVEASPTTSGFKASEDITEVSHKYVSNNDAKMKRKSRKDYMDGRKRLHGQEFISNQMTHTAHRLLETSQSEAILMPYNYNVYPLVAMMSPSYNVQYNETLNNDAKTKRKLRKHYMDDRKKFQASLLNSRKSNSKASNLDTNHIATEQIMNSPNLFIEKVTNGSINTLQSTQKRRERKEYLDARKFKRFNKTSNAHLSSRKSTSIIIDENGNNGHTNLTSSNQLPGASNGSIRIPLSNIAIDNQFIVTPQKNLQRGLKWYGYPDFFITVTCNPKWPEVKRFLEDTSLNPEDRPDILCRLFKIKLDSLITDLKDKSILGKVSAVVYTIEFQKRGLPHAHICLFMRASDKYPTVEHIDPVISAEIPDPNEDLELYTLVSDFMIHGPCGSYNMKCSCMVDKKCSKSFPKPFRDHTSIDSNGYPLYRRRASGHYVEKSGIKLYNESVVPYNKTLLRKYQAHINVEWCNQAGSIKYLFKYINKGPDRVTVAVEQENTESDQQPPVDEIKNFYDCRYLSACEATWRIFSYDVHHRYPSVIRLPFHLPNQQQVVYGEDDDIDNVLSKPSAAVSKFLGWMECNETNEDARKLSYVEFPTKFVWKQDELRWKERKNGISIGRIHSVPSSLGEAYYLRILLNKVKGPKSFEDICTVDGQIHPTFRQACFARGLLDDDTEYVEAIQEASHAGSGYYLRTLFATMLTCQCLSRPEYVWEKTWEILSDGILHKQRIILKNSDLSLNDEQLQNLTL
ncbi:hypothetical protein QVD17_38228 [Tagetes erecta]|uniref:Helitron helicase-like domain-containing protein n=1 Tax=Tagetes erecta TaxID=13708 RepID=A0AAD8JZQ0_TARER|nr:hypothetical protein QVD17_38228 [Tagetes erecta]